MAWDFLWLNRNLFQGSNHDGTLYIKSKAGRWERLCYVYELPWILNSLGKSKNDKSRIRIGTYELKPETKEDKGWVMRLQKTGHRKGILIHRAHKTLSIEGCILPVHFDNRGLKEITDTNQIQEKSVQLMNKIKQRYTALKTGKTGNPTITISANLPARGGTWPV